MEFWSVETLRNPFIKTAYIRLRRCKKMYIVCLGASTGYGP